MTHRFDTSLLPHHRLRAYSVAVELLAAVRQSRIRDRVLRDQALRAAKSACLNCAEGAGRFTRADKARAYTVHGASWWKRWQPPKSQRSAVRLAARPCRVSSRWATSCTRCSRNSFAEHNMEIYTSRHPSHQVTIQRKDASMRQSLLDQLPLVPVAIDHDIARELGAASDVLDQLPEAVKLIHEDLSWRGEKRVDPTKGRHGMAAEQVLRVVVLKQMIDCSYKVLAFHLADSATYRTFCRLGFDREPPKKATLQKNVKRLKPETLKAINDMVTLKAKALGIENGKKVRTDCTVVESNIHHPNDSSLLWDSVRVLARLMQCARDEFGKASSPSSSEASVSTAAPGAASSPSRRTCRRRSWPATC